MEEVELTSELALLMVRGSIFRQACKEAGLTVRERYEASQALHVEKETGGGQEDMSYGELLAWLRQWKDTWRPS
jgi:hypothetical protein